MNSAKPLLALLAAGLFACGGDGTPPDPGQPPRRVASINVSPGSAELRPDSVARLAAVALDSGGTAVDSPVTWSSSDTTIARVSTTGVVTGVGRGRVNIAATAGGITGTAAILVRGATEIVPFDHVFVLFLENRDYDKVIGNTTDWPWLNSVAGEFALATQFRSVTHPSIGNYFMAMTGDTVTNNDSYTAPVDVDNIVRRLLAAGLTWKAYAEDLPSVGFIGGNRGNYYQYHNPFSYFTDVRGSADQRNNLVPFTQLAADLSAGTLPNYGFLLPNACNDGHNCVAEPDPWLRAGLEPLIRSPLFQNSLLIITFDESVTWSPTTGNGWRIPFVLISPRGKRAFTSTTAYTHAALLRLQLEALGVMSWPGAGATAPSMFEFFTR